MSIALIAESQTDAVIGSGTGTRLQTITIIPATTTIGVVTLKDGAVSYPLCAGGTVASLAPVVIPINARSRNAAWTITTGAGVSVLVSC